MGEDVNAFVKRYGGIGVVALEIANRMAYPLNSEGGTRSWKAFTEDCNCAMCKQWHHGWSDKRVVNLYRKLYQKQYNTNT